MNAPIHPVVLSGGTGSRLWPMSRALLPKQFLPLLSERTMLQETLSRLAGLPEAQRAVVVSNAEHRFLVAEQLREIGLAPQAQILEPVGRNTAPAVAVAALCLAERDPDALMLVLPADHLVRDVARFHDAIRRAARVAARGYLVTFGIVPTAPETGYGYIERDELLPEGDAFGVVRFVEKPDRARAEEFVASGRFSWNSGMFVFTARRFLDELRALAPAVLAHAETAWARAVRDLDFHRLDPEAFGGSPSISVDYAVMEKTARAAVLPIDIGWSDVGSWATLHEVGPRDAQGNVLRGDVHVRDAENCYIRAESRMVTVLGLRNAIVVETDDAILVADQARAQDVKEVVGHLEAAKRTEHLSHRRVYRPWGYYESVDAGDRFQVKRIMVKPGAALSLQMHHHRAEHWIVVSGTAKVTCGDQVVLLSENQSTYIPLGVRHRLENPGKVPLFLIEVQSGAYLGEDDIVRFEDRYRRE
jgi:mannose-1-phosphate guanylyltransferase/mannose-6-phosphate isomerase